ncbi:helix-turn-helix transcriptional regulator [Paraflavitalea sp. CAU 1676]|uniref:helix-turn-helix domain-containing protein n=1 Tax=Paraflavitalea sp. CAU 1676 TaxID=3032598 RepID=UPI0023DC79B9|nr:helix-turn-helix transcriptional regulator [Paraflavitalea sp. CAU 1676]MDF2190827.1 helix-turn-helix transcriptional regulator [Paraflavitalea sp. CAU 1676]
MEQSLNFFGKNLQFLRKEKKLRQHQMFDSLGFSRTTWSNYEQCRTAPSLDGLIRISRFFGVTLDELIAEDIELKFEGRKYKRYAINETLSLVEESNEGLDYLKTRLERLENEVGLIRNAREESPF